MPKPKHPPSPELPRIIRKKIPASYRKVRPEFAHFKHARAELVLTDGSSASFASTSLRSFVRARVRRQQTGVVAQRQIENALTFIHNYYVTHQAIPTKEQLEKVFPYRRKT